MKESIFRTIKPFSAYENDVIKKFCCCNDCRCKGGWGGGGLEGVTVHVLKCQFFSVSGTIIFCLFWAEAVPAYEGEWSSSCEVKSRGKIFLLDLTGRR